MATETRTPSCSMGLAEARYTCRFCGVSLHRGGDPCPCSTYRPTTHYASLCIPCAEALDALEDSGTRLGKVHKQLVREEWHKGRGPFGGD